MMETDPPVGPSVPPAPPPATAGIPAHESSSPDVRSDTLPVLTRLEKLVGGIHAALDARLREQKHKDFSPAWLAGAILQVLVVGLVMMAGMDCLFQVPVGRPVLKLAFALVLQGMALTAFVVAGDGRR
jgi:hypothetical protein